MNTYVKRNIDSCRREIFCIITFIINAANRTFFLLVWNLGAGIFEWDCNGDKEDEMMFSSSFGEF